MAAVPPSTSGDFLTLCRKSGLFAPGQLDGFLAKIPVPPEPTGTAKLLVQAGLLTRFQAKNLLFGKYRGLRIGQLVLLSQIGQGGMGAVFLCQHKGLNKQVAVKFLPEGKAAEPGLLKRFLREARSAAALDHPNIIRTHNFDACGNTHYLVMEYVEGTDLEKLVRLHGALDPAKAANYIRQAALGLQHAHEKGLIHRDIKPANLLLDKGGVVKILDFGLARSEADAAERLTEKLDKGAVLGTADYMAPEQVIGAKVDIRADIYALGVTFYTLLTGRPPFTGTTSEKFTAHQVFSAPSLSKVRPDVPADIGAVVEKMMAKSPADRYQTPQEVITALDACGRAALPVALVIAAPEPPVVRRPPPRRTNRKRLWVGGSVAAACLLGLVAWALMPKSKAASGSGNGPNAGQVNPPPTYPPTPTNQ
jgi:serine/threonine protein kinase